MTNRLRQRLARTFGTLVAFTIIGIGIVVSAIVYGMQVRSLSDACAETVRIIDDILIVYPAPKNDAHATLDALMTHLSPSNLIIVVSDGRTRYEGRWVSAQGEAGPHYAVTTASRNVFPEPSQISPFVDRAARSVAALVGYKGSSTRAGDASVQVIADAVVLKTIAWHSFLVLAGFICLALILGYALGRAMSRQALEPMVMVSEALEAFAAGDLTPRPVRTRRGEHDELDRLAIAYNAAMVTMSQAFAERARAETAMRQFIADASHQLRTPLTVLRGFTGILRRREFDNDEDFARIVDTMDGQSAIMTSLLQKLLLLESWESVPAEGRDVIDVAGVVERVVAPIAASHRNRDVRLQLAPNAFAAIDPDELHHALANLVTNALNYAPEGAISVEVSVAVSGVRITVADEGPGMTDEELNHAFDRFYRGARRDVAGSGLGLAIAKRAVERANGTLSVESTPGRGSRFTITLALALAPQPPAPATRVEKPPAQTLT